MNRFLWGLLIPDLDGTPFLANYVFEDKGDALDCADEICVAKHEPSAKVIPIMVVEKEE